VSFAAGALFGVFARSHKEAMATLAAAALAMYRPLGHSKPLGSAFFRMPSNLV
jgi:hypothetical protein